MFNYTLNTYEMKRDILNFSNKMSNNLTKPTRKFIVDSLYGIAKSKSCLISNIARALKEDVKLKYVIERLCDNYSNLSNDEINIIKYNYYNEVKDLFMMNLAHTGIKEWQHVEERSKYRQLELKL